MVLCLMEGFGERGCEAAKARGKLLLFWKCSAGSLGGGVVVRR